VPYKSHSREELEKIAEEFLQKNTAGKYDNRALMIEAVIEGIGYTIHPVPGLAEIAEAYVPAKKGYIFVDEEQYMNGSSFRWRFTMAEELAHILIHRPIFDDKSSEEIVRIQEAFTDSEYRRIEQDAKYLAGCLLMPKEVFLARFKHFFDFQSQRSSNYLNILYYVMRQLSMDFNVSCQSVSIRALHLDQIDQSDLEDLLEMFDG